MWSRVFLVAAAVGLFCISIDAAKSDAQKAAEEELDMLMDEDDRMPPKRAATKAKAPKAPKAPKQAKPSPKKAPAPPTEDYDWDDDVSDDDYNSDGDDNSSGSGSGSSNTCDPSGTGDGKCPDKDDSSGSKSSHRAAHKEPEYRSRADELREMYEQRDRDQKAKAEAAAAEHLDPDDPDWTPDLPSFTPEEAALLSREEKKEIMREGMRQIREKNKPKRERAKQDKLKKKQKARKDKVSDRKKEKARKKAERKAAKAKKKAEKEAEKKAKEEEERKNRPPPPPTFGGLWSKRSQDICRKAIRRHELGQLAPVYTCREIEKKIKKEFTKWGDGGSKSMMQNAIHDRLKNSPFADHAREAAEQVGEMPPPPELSKLLETAEKEPFRSAGMLLIKRIVIDTVDNFFNQTWKKENNKRTIDAISTHVVRTNTLSWLANVEAENSDVMRTMNREYRFK